MKEKVVNFIKDNKKIVVLVLVVILILAIILGATLAYMRANATNENKTKVALNSCAKITLLDGGDSINITNTAAMSDNRGLNTEPYQFTVSNKCDASFYYTMYLGITTSSTLDASDVKYAITNEENDVVIKGIVGEQTEATSTFNSDEINQLTTAVGTTSSIYSIMNSGLTGKSERTYNLYLWVDGDAGNDTMNQSFTAGFMVRAGEEFEPPVINEVIATATSDSINVSVTATEGDNEIKQYHYYLNDELKSTTTNNSYTYSGLTKATTYEVSIIVEDIEGNLSEVYSMDVTTDNITLLADCIKDFYTTDGENGLYLHDADLANGANDGSYRYAGASESVNNYVCFASDAETCPDDNLYRIIGVFGDNVKLIKSDYATSAQLGTDGDYQGAYTTGSNNYKGANYANVASYYWDSTNDENIWANSSLNTVNLNTNYIAYLNGINTKWANMIETTTWKVGGNTYANIVPSAMNVAYQNEIVNPAENTTYTDEIGLMYVSDYGYAASPTYWTYPGYSSSGASNDYRAATGSNWMYMGLYEWTISRSSDYSYVAFFVLDTGLGGIDYVWNNRAVRPSFSLKSSITYDGGSGTADNPFRISMN